MTSFASRGALVALFIMLVTAAPASASFTTDTFTGAISSDWNTAGNWDNGVPNANSDVVIPAGKSAVLSTGADGTANLLQLTHNGSGGGSLTISNGKTLTLATTSTLDGQSLTIGAGSTLNLGATSEWYSGNISIAGTLTVPANGYFILLPATSAWSATAQGSGVVKVLSGGTLEASQSGFTTVFDIPVMNAGTVLIDPAAGPLQLGSVVQTGGETFIPFAASLQTALTLDGGVLDGAGTLIGALDNEGGTVAPGASAVQDPSDSAINTFHIAGNFTQGAGGRLAADIGGPASGHYDVLAVTGTATVGGTLAISTSAGYSPQAVDTFQVLTATGGRSGQFASLTGTTAGSLTYSPTYHANDVTLGFSGSTTTTTSTTTTSSQTTTTTSTTTTTTSTTTTSTGTPSTGSKATLVISALPRPCVVVRPRHIRVRLTVRGRATLKSAIVYVNGKKRMTLRGRKLRAVLDLRELPKGTAVVKVVAVTTDGRRLTTTRRFAQCGRRIKA